MTRRVLGGLAGLALVVALGARVAAPDLRPMHHDEANQAVKFAALLEQGTYQYDRDDHHGPTLYFLTLPVAWLRGQTTLSGLDERTLRLVPAISGLAFLLLILTLSARLGRVAVAIALALAALSPALTYYNRFYIQESLLVFFGMAFVVALGRYADRPSRGAAAVAGLCAGLAFATKETSVIVMAAAGLAWIVAWWRTGRPWSMRAVDVAIAALVAAGVAGLFYSSFFRDPSGPIESVLAFGTYLQRGVDPARHVHPWHYYLGMLVWHASGGVVWSEALIVGLAVVGMIVAARAGRDSFWPPYLAVFTLATTAVFSLLRYKTPWNVLPFHAGFVILAGVGAQAVLARARGRLWQGVVGAVLVAGAAHLGVQNWRANVRYPADPRNPYVYAQTSTDLMRLVTRIHDLSAVHPDGGAMFVKVLAGPYEQWPLPWYLRRLGRVGYWPQADASQPIGDAPVIIASEENASRMGTSLDAQYQTEYYGLRPDVLLALYIDRGLWERYLATR